MDNSSEITQATATLRQLNNLYNGLNETINKVEDDYNIECEQDRKVYLQHLQTYI